MSDSEPYVHYEFWHSHYCEKTRWALDLKGAPYRPKLLVPVQHALPMILRTGQRQVPVLAGRGVRIAGSTAILEHLEAAWPDPPLFPRAPALRAEVDEAMGWFDRKLGPGIRRAFFYRLMPHTALLNDIMARPAGPIGRAIYTATTPLNKLIMRKAMGIDAAGAERGEDITRQALERLAALGDGYLVGDRFTAADLTAAALLYPLSGSPDAPHLPPDRPADLSEWLDGWRAHPGTAWVRRIYAEHRRPPA